MTLLYSIRGYIVFNDEGEKDHSKNRRKIQVLEGISTFSANRSKRKGILAAHSMALIAFFSG
jgi:hypothetical protein